MTAIKSNKNLVVKANRLMEAKFQFKLWEMRIFEQMVSMINKDEKEFKLCKIYIKDLVKFFNSKSNNDHLLIKNAAYSLGDKKLHVSFTSDKGHKRWAKLNIFPTVTIPDPASREETNAYVELEFHKDLKPYLLDLQANFKSYDIRNFRHLKSVYSMRMFILLKQYEVIGKRKFSIEDLKEVLGIGKEQYKLYGDFKKRIIIKPQQELAAHCDISFSFKEHKNGRRVEALTFYIHPNKKQRDKGEPALVELSAKKPKIAAATKQDSSGLVQELYPKVAEWITQETLQSWVDTYPEDQLRKGIQYTLHQLQKGKNISSVGGYMRRMIAEENLQDQVADQKEKKAKAKKKAKDQERKKQQLEEQYRQLQKELSDQENDFIDQLFLQQPTLKTNMIEKAKQKNMSGFNPMKSEEENLQSPIFLAAVRSVTLEDYRTELAALYEKYEPKIQAAKRALSQF